MGSNVPGIDAGVRQRLTARFGSEVEAWFDQLPGLLTALGERWQLQFGAPIPRGSMSAVYRCRMADGRGAVLKASPDRARLAFEAAALGAWPSLHTPAVLALDEQLGALLIELIEPGTPLVVASVYPAVERVAELLRSLHASGVADPSYPPVSQRVAYLFDPAPCLGDAAFDAVDLLLWQAEDLGTIQARTGRLAAATGVDPERLSGWCAAFAAMIALELASQGTGPGGRIDALLKLASRA
jgi:hypothetical protein